MKISESANRESAKKEDVTTVISDKDKLGYTLEVWKKTIDVQQHFNTLEMQIRNFAVTVFAGIVGAAGLALRDPKSFVFFSFSISVASAILVAGVVVWAAFYMMDRWWYHRLLQGAVLHARKVEDILDKQLPGIDLSNTIKAKSPFYFFGRKSLRMGSDQKIDLFYSLVLLFLVVAAIGVR